MLLFSKLFILCVLFSFLTLMPFTYATAINCIDGRIQLPIIYWIKERFGVDHVDSITEAGPNRVLAQCVEPNLSNVKYNLAISVNGHGSRIVTLSGHYDCARNPVPRDIQISQVMEGIRTLKSWGFPIRILGLYVNEEWEVELLYDSESDPRSMPAQMGEAKINI